MLRVVVGVVEMIYRPAVVVQRHCHSVAVSADVVVLSPARPIPSAVAHAPPPTSLVPCRSTLSATLVQSEPASCPPRAGRTAAAAADAPSPRTLCAVAPPFAASQCSCLASPAPAASAIHNKVAACKRVTKIHHGNA